MTSSVRAAAIASCFLCVAFYSSVSLPIHAQDSATADDPGVSMAEPITVIAHGYRSSGEVPLWTTQLQAALQDRRISGVLLVDWAAESNDSACGWAEGAADRAFARLISLLLAAEQPRDVHFIGHSRGAVVCSEIQRRLNWYQEHHTEIDRRVGGVDVTMLDPHPANGQVGYWSESKDRGEVLELFESMTRDPEPVIWPNTRHSAVYFQQARQATVATRGVNPWGYGDIPGADVVYDLTDTIGTLIGPKGDPETIALLHCELPLWYASSMMDTLPSVVTDGITFRAGDRNDLQAVNHAIHTEDDQVPHDRPESVFNGDFRYHSRTHPYFRRLRESKRIPGWRSNDRIRVTADERVRMKAAAGLDDTCAVTRLIHERMVIPGGATLSFDVVPVALSGDCFLRVYFTSGNAGGHELKRHEDRLRELGAWHLDSIGEALRVTLPLSSEAAGISTGSFEIELEASPGARAEIELDNVNLTAPVETEFAVR